jgi:hypothetical protein
MDMSTGAGDSPVRPVPGERLPASERGAARSLFADPRFGPLPALLVLLTVVTGVVDAVSILALGRVFVANMTGNVVFAAFALVGAPGFSLSASLFALAGFLAGAYAGGLMITRSADRGALALRVSPLSALGLATALLAVAALGTAVATRGGGASGTAAWRAFPAGKS